MLFSNLSPDLESGYEGSLSVYAECPKCGLRVHGTSSDPAEAEARFYNNLGLHRRGSRCWKRRRAQKRAQEG